MPNPFVGTWDTKFDRSGAGAGTFDTCTLTLTESIRFGDENVVDGMHEGVKGGQPSTLHGTFNPKQSALIGRWVNTPSGAPEHGTFTFTLVPNHPDTFTGTWQGTDGQKLRWNGRLRRKHRDLGNLSDIPPLT